MSNWTPCRARTLSAKARTASRMCNAARQARWALVFMRDRRAEQRHHAVSGELVDRALEAMHPIGDDLEEILDDAEPLLGIEPFGEVHRAFDIGK
jgi:hypothetical protein